MLSQASAIHYVLNFGLSESKILASNGHDLTGQYLRHILASMHVVQLFPVYPFACKFEIPKLSYLAIA